MKILSNNCDLFIKKSIELMIFINNDCNLDCPYCFVKQEEHLKSDQVSKEKIDFLVSGIKEIKYPTTIHIMGGEPTLSSNLQYSLDQFSKLSNVNRVNIFTNGIEDLQKFRFYKNNVILFTYHNHCDLEKIFNNINYCLSKNLDFSIFVPLTKNYNDLQKFRNFIKEKNIKKVYPLYVYLEKRDANIFNKDALFPEIEYNKILRLNGKEFSCREVFKRELNKFKGFKCYNNVYQIRLNGDILWNCGKIFGNVYRDKSILPSLKFRGFKCSNEKCVYVQDWFYEKFLV